MTFTKHKNKIVIVAVIIIIVMSIVAIYNWVDQCDSVYTIPAELTIKNIAGVKLLGLNTDTDALKFGTVSSGIWPKRKINFQHAKKAEVEVRMNGDLAPWTEIEPLNFTIIPNVTQEVSFTVGVPAIAKDGNYTGQAVFCIKNSLLQW